MVFTWCGWIVVVGCAMAIVWPSGHCVWLIIELGASVAGIWVREGPAKDPDWMIMGVVSWLLWVAVGRLWPLSGRGMPELVGSDG